MIWYRGVSKNTASVTDIGPIERPSAEANGKYSGKFSGPNIMVSGGHFQHATLVIVSRIQSDMLSLFSACVSI